MRLIVSLAIFCSASQVLMVGVGAAHQCPDNIEFFEGSCYAYIDDYVSWTAAKTICQLLYMNLVEINTPEENAFLANISLTHNSPVWIGLEDFVREGHWVYVSNQEPPEYTFWAPGEPNNDVMHSGGQDCAILKTDGFWDDDFCDNYQLDREHTFICETSPISGPVG